MTQDQADDAEVRGALTRLRSNSWRQVEKGKPMSTEPCRDDALIIERALRASMARHLKSDWCREQAESKLAEARRELDAVKMDGAKPGFSHYRLRAERAEAAFVEAENKAVEWSKALAEAKKELKAKDAFLAAYRTGKTPPAWAFAALTPRPDGQETK